MDDWNKRKNNVEAVFSAILIYSSSFLCSRRSSVEMTTLLTTRFLESFEIFVQPRTARFKPNVQSCTLAILVFSSLFSLTVQFFLVCR